MLYLHSIFLKTLMETWELDFEWLKVRHIVKNAFGKSVLPDLQGILFLIGTILMTYNFLKTIAGRRTIAVRPPVESLATA